MTRILRARVLDQAVLENIATFPVLGTNKCPFGFK